ncbi:hypothetical protein TNCV_4254401 [Trichonephila clavipes]|nr:hypothetical protein TNCV_4254401 [Trichonephila clavipes]
MRIYVILSEDGCSEASKIGNSYHWSQKCIRGCSDYQQIEQEVLEPCTQLLSILSDHVQDWYDVREYNDQINSPQYLQTELHVPPS